MQTAEPSSCTELRSASAPPPEGGGVHLSPQIKSKENHVQKRFGDVGVGEKWVAMARYGPILGRTEA